VWVRAHQLTLDIYESTSSFPREEVYGLTAQMRRSSASRATNIAEGCGRSGPKDLARFLGVAMGSASELEYQLLLARDLNVLSPDRYTQHCADVQQVKRMLAMYINRIYANLNSDI
jgi:four helix bundle protein